MFKDSFVTHVTPWTLTEEATALPISNFPAYIGSGSCVVSIDSSGLQGLNHGVQKAFRCVENAGDLYVIKHGYIADAISAGNALPLGFLQWEMELDGEIINSENLAGQAFMWSRTVFIDEGKVVTRMLLKDKLVLEIAAIVPFGSSSPLFEISFQGHDLYNRTIATPHQVKFSIDIQLTTRQGKPLFDEARLIESTLCLKTQGHEDYELSYQIFHDTQGELKYENHKFGLEWEMAVGSLKQTTHCLFSLDDTKWGAKGASPHFKELAAGHLKSWKDYYSGIGHIEGLAVEEAFMLHNSQYLLRAGFEYNKGIPIGSPFYLPWCWQASTFWDSHFVAEALMKTGDRESLYSFIDFLYRSMRENGKPYSWMFLYDGVSLLPEDRDIAPLVISAHAMTAIKTYEYYRDEQLLIDRIFPICKRITDFAIDSLFSLVDGRWIVSLPVSNDVVEEEAVEVNHTYTMVWFLTVLKKTLEYAERLKQADTLDPRYVQILEGYYLEQNGQEYLHARDMTAEQCPGASWIPFLLFPTEGKPFIDEGLFKLTRAKYDFTELYMRKQGCYQPWCSFLHASSDFRKGDIEVGYHKIQEGLSRVFGPGLFSEIGPRQETVGLPPYITAHGAFITALFYQFVADSLWENRLNIFSSLPAALQDRQLKISNIVCMGGIRLSAEYSRYQISVSLQGKLDEWVIRLPIPKGLHRNQVRVWANGDAVNYKFIEAENSIEIIIAGDQISTEIILR